MKRFKYVIVADKIGNKGGHGKMTPHSITTHHSGVVRKKTDNAMAVMRQYAGFHGGSMPYHFFIPFNDSDIIYVSQYVTHYTWHNANGTANRDAIAVCLDGNFQSQKPRKRQLEKYKQLLDDLHSKWFSKNGWTNAMDGLDPRGKENKKYAERTVKVSHYHNEVARPGYATACCGTNLIPYVLDYRKKGGKVDWGQKPTPPKPKPPAPPKPTPPHPAPKPPIDECAAEKELIKKQEEEIEKLEDTVEAQALKLENQAKEITDLLLKLKGERDKRISFIRNLIDKIKKAFNL